MHGDWVSMIMFNVVNINVYMIYSLQAVQENSKDLYYNNLWPYFFRSYMKVRNNSSTCIVRYSFDLLIHVTWLTIMYG